VLERIWNVSRLKVLIELLLWACLVCWKWEKKGGSGKWGGKDEENVGNWELCISLSGVWL